MRIAILLVLAASAGCRTQIPFTCASEGQCAPGQRCVDGACAGVDTTCQSGWRFDPSAKMGAVCVPLELDMSMPPDQQMPPPVLDMAQGQGCGCDMAIPGLGLGAACNADAQCAGGHCTDGVCCSVPSCSACNACGGDGTCHPKVANALDSRCATQDPSTCGTTGHCDGAGACAFYPPTTVCDAPHCDVADVKLKHPNTTYCAGGGAPCNPQSVECTITSGTVKCCVLNGSVTCCGVL